MPEAVIVATARTPIGRANKGSLTECRPDDLSAHIIKAVLDKVPSLDPQTVEDVIWGCGQPGGEAGYNVARVAALLAGPARRPRRHREPLLLLVAPDDPHGRPRHQGRRGRRVRGRRRRDGEPLPPRRVRHRPAQPAVRRRRGPHAPSAPAAPTAGSRRPASPTSTSPWARPPRTWCWPRASPARRWTSGAPARSSGPSPPRSAASSTGRSRRSPSPTAPSCRRTTAPARAPPSRSSPS